MEKREAHSAGLGALLLGLSAWLGACAHSEAARSSLPPSGAQSEASALLCEPRPVSLAEARVIVAKRCVSCHSSTGVAGPDYDWTHEPALVAHRRNVAAQVSQGTMPPVGFPRLSAAERQTLFCWAQSSG